MKRKMHYFEPDDVLERISQNAEEDTSESFSAVVKMSPEMEKIVPEMKNGDGKDDHLLATYWG